MYLVRAVYFGIMWSNTELLKCSITLS